ncbi:hypothetical protein, partial [Streptomyces sp. NRRL S-495]|uniref:hypothetical protein n=1 Tax=Streptomyces sp. NRRL S-495 TaxID=1609133 RepID=UPI001331448E
MVALCALLTGSATARSSTAQQGGHSHGPVVDTCVCTSTGVSVGVGRDGVDTEVDVEVEVGVDVDLSGILHHPKPWPTKPRPPRPTHHHPCP